MEYTKLEYIESTGTQYINTGVNNINGVEIQFQYLAYKQNASAFGARNGDSSDSRFGLTLYDGYFHIMPPGQNVNGIITNKHIFKFGSNVNYQCYMDGELKINKIPTYKSSYNTYLFCECSGGYPSFYSNNLKIYYCKLYKDEILVRDFIPCEYNGKIGLWDKVTNQFFANNGTGKFVAGPTIGPRTLKVKTVEKNNLLYKRLEYIERTGTQYIDLGFKLSSNHAVDLDLQMVNLNANIFGSRAGAQYRAFTLFSSTSVIMTDMGDTRNSTSPTTDRINVYLSSSKIKIGTFERNINSGSFTTPDNGYIFNISYSRPQYYMASMKLYGCKIYLSGTLIRDLIPCKYNNKIGLWDTINGSFLGNAGTGEFVAGPYSLIGKTVSKINGKYAKTINGVSVQCWKKKYE